MSLISSKNEFNHEKTSSASQDITSSENTVNSQTDLQHNSNSEFDNGKLCTELNLNSRLKQAQIRKEITSDDALPDRAETIAKRDRIVLNLLPSELSGGKKISGQGRFSKKSINAMSYRSIVFPVDCCSVAEM